MKQVKNQGQDGSEFSQPPVAGAGDTGRAVDVFDLAQSGGSVEGRLPLGQAMRLRAQLRDTPGAIDYRLDGLVDARGRLAARLFLRATLPLTCDRCALPMELPLDEGATFYFVRDEAELAAVPVEADDDAEALLGSDRFDIEALVEDEAILCIPVSPRHTVCPVSGEEKLFPRQRTESGANPFVQLAVLLNRKQR